MSFEGYYKLVCENRHYSTMDAYLFSYTRTICCQCGGKIAESTLVDTTNEAYESFSVEYEEDNEY